MYWSPEGSFLTTLEEDGTLKVSYMYNYTVKMTYQLDSGYYTFSLLLSLTCSYGI